MRLSQGGGDLNVVVRSPPLYPRGGLKWRDNYPEGPYHPVVGKIAWSPSYTDEELKTLQSIQE